MIEVKGSSGAAFSLEVLPDGQVQFSDKNTGCDVRQIGTHNWHVLMGDRSHVVYLNRYEEEERKLWLRVDGIDQCFEVKDQHQQLLEKMGLSSLSKKKLKELKAPMPGLVVRILANEGDEIPKGGSLLVLEAMKMENIIKSPEEVTIASIEVSAGDAVEKNQSLIKFK